MHKFVNIVLVKGDQVLLQLRDNKPNIFQPNVWSLPGGRIDAGETEKEAIEREFKEETGYTPENPIFIKKISYDFFDGENEVNIFAEIYDGVQKINCYEGQAMEFISIDNLNDLPFFPMHADLAREAIRFMVNK